MTVAVQKPIKSRYMQNTRKTKIHTIVFQKEYHLYSYNSHWINIWHLYKTLKTQQLFKFFILYFSEISLTLLKNIKTDIL